MYEQLQAALGYSFQNQSLLRNALTHSSYANENRNLKLPCNERLEFLGDSVLGFVVAEFLYHSFPDRPEGEMTRMRADMVCEAALAVAAQKLNLGNELLLGHGEAQNGGRTRASILADAMESVIAAAYLDGGFEAAHHIIQQFILCCVPKQQLRNMDYKTMLQEHVQQQKDQYLTYHLTGESGPDHNKRFAVEVRLNAMPIGAGEGSSKKRAEQAAARAAISALFPALLKSEEK